MSNKETCARCGRDDVHLICITDHPEKHDGMYCEECNPYERDRKRLVSTNNEAEKAARERTRQLIESNAAFKSGVEWERKRIREKYCPSYITKPESKDARLCHVIPVEDLKDE